MNTIPEVFYSIIAYIVIFLVVTLPMGLTAMNIFCLIKPRFVKVMGTISWSCTVFFGVLLSVFYASFIEIHPFAEWSEQLYNNQKHQPFWTGALGLYIAIAAVAVAGFIVLAIMPLKKTPPLLFVLAMAAQYPFMATCIVWCVQISSSLSSLLLAVLPVNLIIIILTMFRLKITAWQEQAENRQSDGKVIDRFDKLLNNSKMWPLFALIAALPLLGVILGISVLLGQSPDAIIKAWTETAEWRLSGKTAPPNLYYDEHYLCTVAAGGHEKIVKPLRMGERHGHRVVVNRQLEIANAFEQVLEERTPHLHRFIRHIYDKYGFPIARCIRTKSACDVVYAIMKPLEWFFLCVIYLTDARPEDRIAVQYMPGYRDFLKEHREAQASNGSPV